MHGILLINKPRGKTSFFLVGALRRLFQERTIGHAGTLDPFATGVMILLIGKPFTKLSDQFLGQEKEYVARVRLGIATDTFDCDGTTQSTSDYIPTLAEIEKHLTSFQGSILQTPPMFSAKKVGGKKLYELARQGKSIERQPVLIHLTTTLLNYTYPYLDLKISCSKGTYIRSIGDDLGRLLGCGAHLTELTRTRSGVFSLNQCLDWKLFSSQEYSLEGFSVNAEGMIQIPHSLIANH